MKKKTLKKFLEKKKIQKKFFFCENEKLDYPRVLGVFYYHGTIILPCIIKPTSICNWVTFCSVSLSHFGRNNEKSGWRLKGSS